MSLQKPAEDIQDAEFVEVAAAPEVAEAAAQPAAPVRPPLPLSQVQYTYKVVDGSDASKGDQLVATLTWGNPVLTGDYLEIGLAEGAAPTMFKVMGIVHNHFIMPEGHQFAGQLVSGTNLMVQPVQPPAPAEEAPVMQAAGLEVASAAPSVQK